LNAANEVAVHAFLDGRLRFVDIAAVVAETLEQEGTQHVHSFDTLAEADARARRIAAELVEARTRA
jgi:1-deoxy-D-xylulose-5-phosphate reductoisomerase